MKPFRIALFPNPLNSVKLFVQKQPFKAHFNAVWKKEKKEDLSKAVALKYPYEQQIVDKVSMCIIC